METTRKGCWTRLRWKKDKCSIQATIKAVNHCWQLDKDYKKKKQQEIKREEEEEEEEEDRDENNCDEDPLHQDCPVYGSKKKYIEEKFIS